MIFQNIFLNNAVITKLLTVIAFFSSVVFVAVPRDAYAVTI